MKHDYCFIAIIKRFFTSKNALLFSFFWSKIDYNYPVHIYREFILCFLMGLRVDLGAFRVYLGAFRVYLGAFGIYFGDWILPNPWQIRTGHYIKRFFTCNNSLYVFGSKVKHNCYKVIKHFFKRKNSFLLFCQKINTIAEN